MTTRGSLAARLGRRLRDSFGSCLVAGLCAACSMDDAGGCAPDDADGVIGGKYTFEVTVDDDAFVPKILKAQNTAAITLKLTNAGTTPHGFSVDCLPTPNDTGCPAKSCFPAPAELDALMPGESATAKFTVPRVEGIYTFRSSVEGDGQKGQFVVQ